MRYSIWMASSLSRSTRAPASPRSPGDTWAWPGRGDTWMRTAVTCAARWWLEVSGTAASAAIAAAGSPAASRVLASPNTAPM